MRMLLALVLFAATPLRGAEMKVYIEGSQLRITSDGKPVLTYQMQPGPVPEGVEKIFMHGAHLHPIWSPSGKVLTADHPEDHRWHRGVWMAWTHTEFEGREPDFWNMGKSKTGGFTGEVRFVTLGKHWDGKTAGFISQHQLIDHTSGAEKPVLNETWEVQVSILNEGHPAYLIDLTSTQTCASNEPLKLPKYHYGGLGVRGNPAWNPVNAVNMLTTEGADRKAGDGKKAKWVHLGGNVDGAATGLAVLIHPDNFRFPQPLRLNPKNPQLCVAPSAEGDWSIDPGKPYVSRYRLVALDGKADAALLEKLWQAYAAGR